MKFSGKMCLKIILKVTKNQGFSLSLEDTLFEKPQGKRGGQIDTPPRLSRFRFKGLSSPTFSFRPERAPLNPQVLKFVTSL